MTADQLAADLTGAGLTWQQMYAIEQKLEAASALASAIREQADYKSDLWDDMAATFDEMQDLAASLLAAMTADVERRMASHV